MNESTPQHKNKRLMLVLAAGLVSSLTWSATAQSQQQSPQHDQARTELDDLMSGPQIDPFMMDEDAFGQFGEHGRKGKRGQRGERRQRGPEGREGRRGPEGPGGGAHHLPPELLERFDSNADGKLDETERAALKAHFEAKRAAFIKQYDTDGDGKLNEDERTAMKASIREQLEAVKAEAIERFDTDGDGKLNQEERLKARDAMRERVEEITGGFGMMRYRGPGDRPEGEGRRGFDGPRGAPGHEIDREAIKRKLLEEFDADGDGKLTGDEREQARDAMRKKMREGHRQPRGERGQRRGRGVRGVDTNRDGVLDEAELAAAADLVSKGDPKADFNRDGKVDSDDMVYLTKRATGG